MVRVQEMSATLEISVENVIPAHAGAQIRFCCVGIGLLEQHTLTNTHR